MIILDFFISSYLPLRVGSPIPKDIKKKMVERKTQRSFQLGILTKTTSTIRIKHYFTNFKFISCAPLLQDK